MMQERIVFLSKFRVAAFAGHERGGEPLLQRPELQDNRTVGDV